MGGLMSVTGPSRARSPTTAGRRPAEGRRRGRRPLHRHVRDHRDPRRAAPPRPHRRRARRSTWRCSTRQVAMLANLGAELPRDRRRAAARRQCAPEHRAVPGVRGRRRPPDPGGRQRRPVRALLRRRRLRRAGRRTRASRATPTACATATLLVPLLAAALKRRSRARLAGRARSRQGAVRADQRPRRGLRRPAGAARAA